MTKRVGSVCRVHSLSKGMIHVLGGWNETARDFITLLRTECNLKFMTYFWNFPFNSFGLQLLQVTETMKSGAADKGGLLYFKREVQNRERFPCQVKSINIDPGAQVLWLLTSLNNPFSICKMSCYRLVIFNRCTPRIFKTCNT